MDPKKEAYKKLAAHIIGKCQLRGMEGHYCENSSEALSLIKELIPADSSVATGGSDTLAQTGIMKYIQSGPFTFYDRKKAATEKESMEIYAKTVCADYFLMSTNAITFDGELVNIDGTGNRVACLITGPKNVIIVAGMNKAAANVEEAISRAKNMAAPANAIRLNRTTPCTSYGKCLNCLQDDCICCHTVVTRKSRINNRIKVILVGEELGF
ncbi:lactate utilization protein [Parasporobacterium paucivorans]|uniref:Uncharacterized ACR, YkgG family COG1556 n=1 Tax=Parasporobacterium paucivorans DSM 15970 TaxID=1122934 RepID=A0A1M6CCF0_9FIRM|nr:lactate utilization protein [Parasporobacterium paucivorans]SHI58464.1 Uncharacterised ACR, YkgG family COG1556 [Parasporobacterium paucivorans DSM 15970]